MASHTQERRQQDYLSLQRILPSGSQIESVALYDKECRILTTTFVPFFPRNKCPVPSHDLLQIQYADVLSPIGSIAIKLTEPRIRYQEILIWAPLAVVVLALFGIFIGILWKKVIYYPLVKEISQLAQGKEASTVELGPIAGKLNEMLELVRLDELRKQKNKLAEQKFENALKVAHDILAPIQLIKKEIGSISSKRSKEALLQIEGIALDLLPEKAPIHLRAIALGDVLDQSIINASIALEKNVSHTLDGDLNERVLISLPHAVRSMTNLLKNAFEVQPEGLPLKISVSDLDEYILVAISDNGPGLPENIENSGTSKIDGSGLGIKSARLAIEKMQGVLTFETSNRGTLTKIFFKKEKSVVYLLPSERVYSFGFTNKDLIEGITMLDNLSSLSMPQSALVFSTFVRPESVSNKVRWIQTSSPKNYRLKHIHNATLIEDDKYVRAEWKKEALAAGINLECYASLPSFVPASDVIFLDRFLDDQDSADWEADAREKGHFVEVISATQGIHSKTPPWLIPV